MVSRPASTILNKTELANAVKDLSAQHRAEHKKLRLMEKELARMQSAIKKQTKVTDKLMERIQMMRLD